jgi:diguanylate cyclase (GGDEF)-like protein
VSNTVWGPFDRTVIEDVKKPPVPSWVAAVRRSRRLWRGTAYENDPVRSDLVIVESLSGIAGICSVIFVAVFAWMMTGSDFDFPWWSKSFTLVVAVIAAGTFYALHTSAATWFYRHTDVVTLIAAIVIVASPTIAYAGARSAYPAFGLVLAVLAFAAVLQRRAHVVVLTAAAMLAWTAIALAFGTGVDVVTFVISMLRTVLVVAVIHYVRFKTIALLWARYRAVDEARAHADSLSHRDDLTGLLNRRGMQRRAAAALESCVKAALPVSVLYLDVDGLKQINDRAGHEAGDAALLRLSTVLTSTFDTEHILARVGGDEFVVVLPGVGRAEAIERGTEASEGLSTAEVSVSVGVAVWVPGPMPPDLDELVRRADFAMYRVKVRR